MSTQLEALLEQEDFEAVLQGISELPLDELPEGYEDEGNVTDPLVNALELPRPEEAGIWLPDNAPLGATSVPFRRLLKRKHPAMRGGDVHAIQRTLRQHGFRKGPATSRYGRGTRKQVRNWQAKHDLDADGIYGRHTHEKLSRRFDRRARHLYGKGWSPGGTTRSKMVKAAMHGYNVRGYMHYTQSAWTYWSSPYGRMYGVRHKVGMSGIPRYEDCSSFATWVYWVSGARDPNGFNYNGYGFTGTLQAHGIRILWSNVRPGDLVFYGWPTSHVAIYVGSGRVVSFGSEIGPLLLNTHYRSDVNSMRSYV